MLKRTATRPTWAEISLGNLRHNFDVVQRHVGVGASVCAVIEADAYGHGATECARVLEDQGARWMGVTSLDEAVPLRDAGIQARILLMTGFILGEEEEVVRLGLTPIVWEVGQVERLEIAAARFGISKVPVHLKVDTGLSRLGATLEDLPELISVLRASSNLVLEGVLTHLANSEVLDAASIVEQLAGVEAARRMLRNQGIEPPLVHVANTGALISRAEALHTMVRPGIALYGYHLPFYRAGRKVSGSRLRLPVKPVLTWKTRILSLRKVRANQALGYSGTYVTKSPARIAVLPVGYADGLSRALSSRGRVIVREHFAPIVGRIAMDITLADVTHLPFVAVGDEVILLGSSNCLTVGAHEHADLANTIVYETLCRISKRVPRYYES
jgi:alanine racemase